MVATTKPESTEPIASAVEQVELFIGVLYAPDDIVEIRAIRKEDVRSSFHRAIELPDQTRRLSALNDDGFNIFVGVNPRERSERGDDAIKLARVVFVDFDHMALADVLAKIADMPTPTMIVISGHGVHCYWKLATPIDDDVDKWRDLQWDLALHLGGDAICRNPERIMRVPGFLNVKREPVACYIESFNAGATVEFSALRSIVPTRPVEQPRPRREGCTPTGDIAKIMERCKKYIAKMPDAISGDHGHDRTFHAFCMIFRFGIDGDNSRSIADWFNDHKCDPRWSEKEIEHKLTDARKTVGGEFGSKLNAKPINGDASGWHKTTAEKVYEACPDLNEPADTLEGIRFDDTGNGRLLVKLHAANVRYCFPFSSWLVSDGKRFRRDEIGAADRLAKATVETLWRQIPNVPHERRDEAYRWAKRSGSIERQAAMLKAARSEPGIAVMPDELDADPWLFNCANGTIDLRTGKLREHRREDLITKLSPVRFEPAAQCPLWESAVYRWMGGREQLVKFVQRFTGYTMTGSTEEQCFIMAHGNGDNGKSVLIGTLLYVLGEYGRQADFTTFLAKDTDGIRNDIAELRGSRIVSAIEVTEGRRLSESTIKSLTGQDRVRARFLFQEAFEFTPQFKLWLACNHRPIIRGTDNGIWRRVRLLPFDVQIPDKEKDKRLMDKLRLEAAGIMAWMVRGCLEWQREGLAPPAEVSSQTESYREESDTFGAFLTACCITGENFEAGATLLYSTYKTWATLNGENPVTQTRFGLTLRERGFKSVKESGNCKWTGLGVVESG